MSVNLRPNSCEDSLELLIETSFMRIELNVEICLDLLLNPDGSWIIEVDNTCPEGPAMTMVGVNLRGKRGQFVCRIPQGTMCVNVNDEREIQLLVKSYKALFSECPLGSEFIHLTLAQAREFCR